MIAPPGAPGAATKATPRVAMKAAIIPKLCVMSNINKTAVTQDVIVTTLPIRWIVALKGITNSLISSDTPLFRAHSMLTGIVAAEDCVPKAVK